MILRSNNGDCSPNIVGGNSTVNCGPPPIQIKWDAKTIDPPEATPDKRVFKYQQQVTVNVSATYTPVSLGVLCNADIGEIQGYLPIPHAELMPRNGTDKNNSKIGFVYFEGTAARPDVPVVISIWSDQPLSVLEVKQARIH
jgi:hypothetical protein